MAYFNHAFCKVFVGTFGDQASSPSTSEVTAGVLSEAGIHVSNLKDSASPYSLGPGVVGLFDAKTDLSVTSNEIGADCCPFYLGAAAIKLNDKQGPFHGGYQESNKSKVINPKYVRKLWKVNGNAPTVSVLQIGQTPSNAISFDTLVGGTGYTDPGATGVPASGGSGTGMLVDYVTDGAGVITSVVISNAGDGAYAVGDTMTVTGGANATFTITAVDLCDKEFICGESYNLRVEVKGTSALRFANHNLYRTFEAGEPCCPDPDNPTATDSMDVYRQWATQIAEDPYLSQFIRPVLVVDGQSYAYDADAAVALGLDPATELFSDASPTVVDAGLILIGSYVDTQFGDCTFQTTDYYQVEPIQILASEVDLNGDPCTFEGLCVTETCPGVQGNGLGEQKVRELILSESYLQNFVANDLRIREITQGTEAYNILTGLSRTAIYSSFYILHSVPRYNNPSGVFDNDQYLLEIIGTDATTAYLESEFLAIETAGCITCQGIEDYSVSGCDFNVPNP